MCCTRMPLLIFGMCTYALLGLRAWMKSKRLSQMMPRRVLPVIFKKMSRQASLLEVDLHQPVVAASLCKLTDFCLNYDKFCAQSTQNTPSIFN
mmetsp:Transcript_50312/g.83508  ORF Transcript_50312/g.83508 Transcript_50312/m.83508 type:complete len:93 (+) Transcript_50312:820-1098(+)